MQGQSGNFNRFPGDGGPASFERPGDFDGPGNTNNNFNNRVPDGLNANNDRTSPVFGIPGGGIGVVPMQSGNPPSVGVPTGINFALPPPNFSGGQFGQDFSVPPPNFPGPGAPPSGPMNNDYPGGFNNANIANRGFRFPSGVPPRGNGMSNRGMAQNERGSSRARFDNRGRGRFPRGRGRGMSFQRLGELNYVKFVC